MTFIQPLDLQTILENILAGDTTIFFFLVIILIGILAGKFRMPNIITLIVIFLFPTFMAFYYPKFYFVVALFAASFVGYALYRIINRS